MEEHCETEFCGSAGLFFAGTQRRNHQRLFLDAAESPRGRQERKPSQSLSPTCGHWSAGSDSGLALNHPGVQRQSPPLFRWTPKIIESVWSQRCRGAPISPSAFSFKHPSFPFSHFTHPNSLLYFFLSSSAPFFPARFLLNLRLPVIPVNKKEPIVRPWWKDDFQTKTAHRVERQQQKAALVGSPESLFHQR